MNTEIKPVKIFGKPDGSILNVTALAFQVGAGSANFRWELSSPVYGPVLVKEAEYELIPDQFDAEGKLLNAAYNKETVPAEYEEGIIELIPVAEGVVPISGSIFTTWGENDNQIIDYIVAELGIEKK